MGCHADIPWVAALREYIYWIFFYAVNKWISELIASATEKMMKQKDERYEFIFLYEQCKMNLRFSEVWLL
jgi:hypothetical protein